ncbi:hypothetical protein K438DRAFT_1972604 [Mycena galopus ATCC 62051]|nr:hypothetical protein K438DRAFT_1972604 [Mycena galopus ATCC 62051]
MKKHHPTIIVLFVPGSYTGVWQPLDVGIQRLLKLSMKRSAHRDLVAEAAKQIKAGKNAHEIKLDTTVGTLRDRSVGWVVQAIHDVGDANIITKAFEMCRVGNWNLSQASLTSPEALAGLRDLRNTNAALHSALTQVTEIDPTSEEADHGNAEDPYQGTEVYNDCDVPLAVVSDLLLSGSVATNFTVNAEGGITRSGDAEASDAEEDEEEVEPAALGRGQRRKIIATRYQGPALEEH